MTAKPEWQRTKWGDAMNSIVKGDFISNLPKIYGLYTGGFIVFILLMALLEQMGLGADTIGID